MAATTMMTAAGGGGRGGRVKKVLWQEKNANSPFFDASAETKISVLLSVSVEIFGVSHMRDFYS